MELAAFRVGMRAAADALPLFDAAIRADPTFVDALYNRGTLREELGDPERAAADYEATLALSPRHENARLNLANCRFALGDHTAAARLQRQLADAALGDSAAPLHTRLKALHNLGQTYTSRRETRARVAEKADGGPTAF